MLAAVVHFPTRAGPMPDRLSRIEQQALITLAESGSGGVFDHIAMSKLFTLKLVDIRSTDRRLVLTRAGRKMYQQIRGRASPNGPTPESARKCSIIEAEIEPRIETAVLNVDSPVWNEKKTQLFQMSVEELEEIAQAAIGLDAKLAMAIVVRHIAESEHRPAAAN